jgi:hypothetical protein
VAVGSSPPRREQLAKIKLNKSMPIKVMGILFIVVSPFQTLIAFDLSRRRTLPPVPGNPFSEGFFTIPAHLTPNLILIYFSPEPMTVLQGLGL